MTEYIKQWIEKEIESSKSNNYPPDILIGIRLGLTKGIEIAEGGFTKWVAWNYLPNTQFDDIWFDKKDGTPFTTSQLLEKFLLTIENK